MGGGRLGLADFGLGGAAIEKALGVAAASTVVRSFAQRVEAVSMVEIRITGGRTELLLGMAGSAGEHAVLVEVRGSKPKWRTRHDSNV
jgi:hypothetical protein